MAPMDDDEFEQLKSAVAEGHVEGQRVIEEEMRTGEFRVPMPAIAKWGIGVITSLVIAAIIGSVGIVKWTGVKESTDIAQAQELSRHDQVLRDLDEKKASKAQLKEQIDVWTAAQKAVLEEVKAANTQQHQDMNSKLDRVIFELRKR